MAGKQYKLYTSSSLGWRVIKFVAYDTAEAACAVGAMERVYDGLNNHDGYHLLPEDTSAPDRSIKSRNHSPAALTAHESELNVGRSRTANMTEEMRMVRLKKTGRAPEDVVELAQAKVRLYVQSANVEGDRAVRVYPRA